MPNSCKQIRAALAECLQASDCVMVQRNSAADCLREPLVYTLPDKCVQLKRGFRECKRGLVDMRKRFRGNAPMAVGEDVEDKVSKGQLYAGKPAVSTETTKNDNSYFTAGEDTKR
ncbi:MAG: hypothetical protein M1814_001912 [Vezdaea aestivalis]|nr:MAG: hypothetical protein M1814_001912 [Vezdaea aestivalis]